MRTFWVMPVFPVSACFVSLRLEAPTFGISVHQRPTTGFGFNGAFMDIAEIREKTKQLKDREEEPALGNEETPSIAEAEIQPEPAPQVELPEGSETQPSTVYAPEVEVRSREGIFDEPVVPDLLKPVPSVDEEVDESDKEGAAEGEVEAIIFSLDTEDCA